MLEVTWTTVHVMIIMTTEFSTMSTLHLFSVSLHELHLTGSGQFTPPRCSTCSTAGHTEEQPAQLAQRIV